MMKCEVSWKKVNCEGYLVILGYSVMGTIMNENQPLPNFHAFLYAKNHNYKAK